jgi:hypothetical protein
MKKFAANAANYLQRTICSELFAANYLQRTVLGSELFLTAKGLQRIGGEPNVKEHEKRLQKILFVPIHFLGLRVAKVSHT